MNLYLKKKKKRKMFLIFQRGKLLSTLVEKYSAEI